MSGQLRPNMTADRRGVAEDGRRLEVGETVKYLAHVSGGMVRVQFADGEIGIVHPHCFPQLR